METVAVIGVVGSSAGRLAEKLPGLLPHGQYEVRLAPTPEEIVPDASVFVFLDDAPPGKASDDHARGGLLAKVAGARAAGRAVVVLCERKAADRWLASVKNEGLPAPPGPLKRVFVASGHSEVSHGRAVRLAEGLGLPFIEPDAPDLEQPGGGWGPRYAAIAQGERWLVHTPSWHAVDVLAPFSDIIIHSETTSQEAGREFPAPNPEARKWRVMFSPWLKRYPGVEAQLLAREVAGHALEAPVFRIRNSDEGETVLHGFLEGAKQGVH
jgi:hypothetical protein